MKMSRILAAMAALAACAFATATQAADAPSYDYVSAGLLHSVMTGSGFKPGHGYFVDADWEVPDTGILVGAGYSRLTATQNVPFGFEAVDRDTSVSLGYKFTLAPNVTFAARLVHDRVRDSLTSGPFELTASDHGNGIAFELRDQVLEQLELSGGFSHKNYQDLSVDTVSVGALCPITSQFAIGFHLDNVTQGRVDGTTTSLFARFQF